MAEHAFRAHPICAFLLQAHRSIQMLKRCIKFTLRCQHNHHRHIASRHQHLCHRIQTNMPDVKPRLAVLGTGVVWAAFYFSQQPPEQGPVLSDWNRKTLQSLVAAHSVESDVWGVRFAAVRQVVNVISCTGQTGSSGTKVRRRCGGFEAATAVAWQCVCVCLQSTPPTHKLLPPDAQWTVPVCATCRVLGTPT
jgi:hypothetical protein